VHTLRRINIGEYEKIFARLREFLSTLKDTLPVREVYLYGSFAKKEIHEGSDIDLLIVGDFRERFFDRIGKILDLTDLPIQPLVYTVDEFEDMKRSKNPFIVEVLRTAVRLV